VYWFGTENVAPGQYQPTAEALKAHLQALYSGWHEPIPQLIAETSPADILHHDIYDLEPLTTWIDQHVVLLGDAAHAMTPNLGQGACQAIEDAYALAHYLASASSIEAALAYYQLLRLPRAKNIMQQSRQIGAAGQLNNPMLCWVRNQAVRLMPASIRDRSLNTVVNYDVTRALSL
jgi:2-polyprenyl-6-methoxyphenol hydroxylase-like FAD-dependent oxidoreductase